MPSNNILNKLKDHGTSGKHDLAPSTVGNDGSSITTTTGVTTTTRTRRSKRQKKYEFQQFDPVFVIWDDNAEYILGSLTVCLKVDDMMFLWMEQILHFGQEVP